MKKDKKIKKFNSWPFQILFLSIGMSMIFSVISELALSKAHLILAVIVISLFIVVSILFDMIGLAVASSSLDTFTAMAARKVRGAKQAIALNKCADKVSSICNDVVGDVCGILAGAGGASILTKITISGDLKQIFVASVVSAIIAGLTIFGKAMFKKLAIMKADNITLSFAKYINIFTRKDKKN